MNILAMLLLAAVHLTPSELIWRAAGPPYPAGVQIVVLDGAPDNGPSTVRLRLPAGTKLTQASRARNAGVTVLSGSVEMDKNVFGAGSYFAAGPFEGDVVATEESVVQVTSDGVWMRGESAHIPSAEVVVPSRSDAAEVTVIDATPASYSDVTAATTIHVRVHYVIKDFKPGEYNLSPMFESTRPGVTVSAPAKVTNGTRPYAITAASGDMTLDVPVGDLIANENVAKPLRMWIYLLHKTGERTSRPVVRTSTATYTVK